MGRGEAAYFPSLAKSLSPAHLAPPMPAPKKLEDGKKLEADVARWMVKTLGYDSAVERKMISYKGSTAYEVDVYATRHDRRSKLLAVFGTAVYAVVLLSLVLGWTEVETFLKDLIATVAPGVAGWAVVIVSVLAGGLALWGWRSSETRAYIECKEYRAKVGRPIVTQMAGRIVLFGDARRRKKGREHWIVVAASGFSQPALEAAEEHGIDCYVRTGRGFAKVIT